VESLSWIKLLLDPSKYRDSTGNKQNTSTVERTKNLIPTGKTVVDMVADYLRCLRKYTLDVIEQAHSKGFIAAHPIEYILTVPAVSYYTTPCSNAPKSEYHTEIKYCLGLE
jgi:hypothetical protein